MLKFKEYSAELDTVIESLSLTEEEQQQIDEVLDTSARIKRKAIFLRKKGRIALARKLQAKRLSTPDRLKSRAVRRAKALLIKRLYQGRKKSDIPLSQRGQVEKKLEKLKGAVKRISTKLLRTVKRDDIARKSGAPRAKTSGSAGAL